MESMGVVKMKQAHITFVHNDNMVEIFLNNQFDRSVHTCSFKQKMIVLSILHTLFSTELIEQGPTVSGSVKISRVINENNSITVYITIGKDMISRTFKIDEDYFEICEFIYDMMEKFHYKDLYKEKSIWNLWGLLK
jgi:S-adenosylmethionine synthetase